MAEVGLGKKGSVVAMEALKYADMYTMDKGFLSIYSHGNLDAKKENPFDSKPPFALDSAQLLYYCYSYAGIELEGGAEKINVKKIRHDKRFKTIFTEGQKHISIFDKMLAGDIIFFGTDTVHVGIYYGEGEFISINGTGDWDASKGLERADLTNGYWWKFFNGAVIRWL